MTPEQRRRRACIAAHASWATPLTVAPAPPPARRRSWTGSNVKSTPLGALPADVRAAMAKHARTAYMLQLAERSAVARRRKAQSSTP